MAGSAESLVLIAKNGRICTNPIDEEEEWP